MAYETLVKANATLGDTLNLITSTVNAESVTPFVLNKVSQLNPTGDKYLFMQRLFDDLINHATYKLDPEGKEMVWTSEKIFREKLYDCKKATTYLAAALKAAGIQPLLKHVFYDNEDFTHIYVIVPYPDLKHYITLDPVNNLQFDKEVDFNTATLFDLNGNIIPMDLYKMGRTTGAKRSYNFLDSISTGCQGIDNDLAIISGAELTPLQRGEILNDLIDNIDHPDNLAKYGISVPDSPERTVEPASQLLSQPLSQTLSPRAHGYFNSYHSVGRGKCCPKLRAAAKKIVTLITHPTQAIKTVGLALPRGAFLLLLKVNALKLASKLAAGWKKNPQAVKDLWIKVGGDIDTLRHNINVGSGVAISGYSISGTQRSIRDVLNMHIPTGQTVAASLAVAAPIVAAVMALLNSLGITDDSDEATVGAETAINDALNNPAWNPSGNNIPEDNTGSDQHTSGSFAFGRIDSMSALTGALIKSGLYYSALNLIFGTSVASFVAIGLSAVLLISAYKVEILSLIKKNKNYEI